MPRNSAFRFRWTVLNVTPIMNNNNNNNRMHVMQIRDRMFRMMFVRIAVAYAAHVPLKARRAIENIILLFSLLSFLSLTYTHTMFIHSPMNCLESLQDDWPKDGILRVEVIHNNTAKSYTIEDSYRKEVMIRRWQAMDSAHQSFIDTSDLKLHPERAKISTNSDANASSFPARAIDGKGNRTSAADASSPLNQVNIDTISLSEDTSDLPEVELHVAVYPPNNTDGLYSHNVSNNFTKRIEETCIECLANSYIVEYSLEYGYLKMSAKSRRQLKVPTKMIILDSSTDKCFGNWLTRFFLDYIVGYDEVLLSSVSRLASKVGNKGFIRNVVKDHYFRFVSVMGHASYAFAAFIMFVFTFSISTLLRYAHHQIFLFIVQLLRMFELRSSVTIQAAPLLTVILSLVGMEAIMSEFFSDPTTSFYVIMIVWVADQYDAICCRTTISRRHWLRFFYLYHFAFYAYEYRFSGQYSNLALFTSCCFIFHSMVYFFHHYELPVIMRFVSRVGGHRGQRMRAAPPPDPDPPDVDSNPEAPTEESSSSSSTSGVANMNDARIDSMDVSDSTSEESSSRNQDDDYDEYTPGSTSSDSSGAGGLFQGHLSRGNATSGADTDSGHYSGGSTVSSTTTTTTDGTTRQRRSNVPSGSGGGANIHSVPTGTSPVHLTTWRTICSHGFSIKVRVQFEDVDRQSPSDVDTSSSPRQGRVGPPPVGAPDHGHSSQQPAVDVDSHCCCRSAACRKRPVNATATSDCPGDVLVTR